LGSFILEAMDYEVFENAPEQALNSAGCRRILQGPWYATFWFESNRPATCRLSSTRSVRTTSCSRRISRTRLACTPSRLRRWRENATLTPSAAARSSARMRQALSPVVGAHRQGDLRRSLTLVHGPATRFADLTTEEKEHFYSRRALGILTLTDRSGVHAPIAALVVGMGLGECGWGYPIEDVLVAMASHMPALCALGWFRVIPAGDGLT